MVFSYFTTFASITLQFKVVLGVSKLSNLIHQYSAFSVNILAAAWEDFYGAPREIFLIVDPVFFQCAKVF